MSYLGRVSARANAGLVPNTRKSDGSARVVPSMPSPSPLAQFDQRRHLSDLAAHVPPAAPMGESALGFFEAEGPADGGVLTGPGGTGGVRGVRGTGSNEGLQPRSPAPSVDDGPRSSDSPSNVVSADRFWEGDSFGNDAVARVTTPRDQSSSRVSSTEATAVPSNPTGQQHQVRGAELAAVRASRGQAGNVRSANSRLEPLDRSAASVARTNVRSSFSDSPTVERVTTGSETAATSTDRTADGAQAALLSALGRVDAWMKGTAPGKQQTLSSEAVAPSRLEPRPTPVSHRSEPAGQRHTVNQERDAARHTALPQHRNLRPATPQAATDVAVRQPPQPRLSIGRLEIEVVPPAIIHAPPVRQPSRGRAASPNQPVVPRPFGWRQQ